MSKFLAPIHYWLYGKISIMEDIEQAFVKTCADPVITDQAKSLQAIYGPYLNDMPLEDIIDQSNIHGWLQEKIAAVETRQAKLMDFAYSQIGKEKAHPLALQVYKNEGRELGIYRSDNKLDTAPDLFKALGDVLLEGMPCDRVNVVTESTAEALRWDIVTCVHENYWNHSLITVVDYYEMRAAFARAYIEGCNPLYTYAYDLDPSNGQKHAIFQL